MTINPLTAIDFYKADHKSQYPKGTTEVYSNFTPRSSRLAYGNPDKVVFFGLQYFIREFLIKSWNEEFFNKDKDIVVAAYKRRMDNALGAGAIDVSHIEALHDLGFLPIQIKALPEGTRCPIGVPVLTIVNTVPEFFWITNYLESVMSCYLWKATTNATVADQYKQLLTRMADETCDNNGHVQFQAHDFSFRGMTNIHDAALSGAAHLTAFVGTDSVPSIDLLEEYYGADATKELVGCSVPATEHSVMCMGSKSGEIDTFRRLICDIYPSGIVSIVSDTWDFWQVMTKFLPELKDVIMAREGKVVIRPDSGDPVDIICGLEPEFGVFGVSPEEKGAIEVLWDTFGGTINSKGYKVLDEHIGLIYGDSITLQRAETILNRLEEKGFAASNIVFGVGSFTYQYNTRDTFGFAMKATSGVVDGDRRDIFKDPKTDDGTKKSARGLLSVHEGEDGELVLHDQCTDFEEWGGELVIAFINGLLVRETTLSEIRERLSK